MEHQTSEPNDWLAWFETKAGKHPRRNEYVGLVLADVLDQIGNSQPLRVIDINAAEAAAESGQHLGIHMDLRPNRINLLAPNGVVVAAAMF